MQSAYLCIPTRPMTTRVTFSIEEKLAKAATEKAAAEDRTMSNYVARLIEADLRAAGVVVTLAADDAQMLGALKDVSAKHGAEHTQRALAKLSRMKPRKLAEILDLPTPDPKRAA